MLAFLAAMLAMTVAAMTMATAAIVHRPCLRVWATWLWAFPLVDTAACDAASVQRNERWTLSSNGTLANEQYGCVEVSRNSAPPSTIWAKPLEGGRMAVLAVNGADMMQTITLDFKKLIGGEGEWEARDVWLEADLGRRASLTRNVPPHDCVLLVLTPTPATPPTRQVRPKNDSANVDALRNTQGGTCSL